MRCWVTYLHIEIWFGFFVQYMYLQMQHSTCRIWGQGLDHDENSSMKMMEEINMFLNLTHMYKW